jgi:hypothetical protein
MKVDIHPTRHDALLRALEDTGITPFTVISSTERELLHFEFEASPEQAFELGMHFAIQSDMASKQIN